MTASRVLSTALALLVTSSGCAIDRMAANNMVPVLRRTETEFERSRTPKAAREAAPGLLVTLDGMVATSPENPELLELAAQMNATFAFGFLEDDEPAWASELYEKAQGYARRAIAVRDDSVLAQVESKLDAKPELDAVDADLVPALFWYGFALGSRINLNRSDEKMISLLGQVDRVMKAVLAADEQFFNAGPHLYFAIRYSSLSKSLGGNPDKAKQHFDSVDRITHDRLLMSKVLRAKFWSCSLQETPSNATLEQMTVAQKKAWDDFYQTLTGVLDAKDDLWPDQRLANEVAKVKARKLLGRPEDANIIAPEGVENPFAVKKSKKKSKKGDE